MQSAHLRLIEDGDLFSHEAELIQALDLALDRLFRDVPSGVEQAERLAIDGAAVCG